MADTRCTYWQRNESRIDRAIKTAKTPEGRLIAALTLDFTDKAIAEDQRDPPCGKCYVCADDDEDDAGEVN